MKEKKYMELALELAKKGEGKVNPNPLVGAVVVKDGKIIGQGYHKEYGGPHAEVFALREAGSEAKGADIYVTLEPCSHYGKTPPCADRIIEAGIKRCIIATKDPNPLVSGRGIEKMEKAGIKVIDGLLEKESRGINDVFMKFIENKEPFVFLKSAITLDGKIATKTGDSKWITNEKARNEVHKLRNRFMGIMVGIGTVLADNPNLTARIENGVNPYRIIIDPNLKTPLDANIIKNNEDKKTIICINKENQKSEKYIEMKEKNVTFLEFQGSKFKMKEVLGKIGELNIDSILVEGGAEVISNVIKENLVDSGVIFIAPKILGDSSAKSFVNGFDITKITDGRVLEVKEIKTYGDNIGIWFGGIKCLQD